MNRKLLLAAISLVLCIAMVGCGNTGSVSDNPSGSSPQPGSRSESVAPSAQPNSSEPQETSQPETSLEKLLDTGMKAAPGDDGLEIMPGIEILPQNRQQFLAFMQAQSTISPDELIGGNGMMENDRAATQEVFAQFLDKEFDGMRTWQLDGITTTLYYYWADSTLMEQDFAGRHGAENYNGLSESDKTCYDADVAMFQSGALNGDETAGFTTLSSFFMSLGADDLFMQTLDVAMGMGATEGHDSGTEHHHIWGMEAGQASAALDVSTGIGEDELFIDPDECTIIFSLWDKGDDGLEHWRGGYMEYDVNSGGQLVARGILMTQHPTSLRIIRLFETEGSVEPEMLAS